ncbi:nucleotidyl transferase AbiEii/AbiGii toxin family protein [Ruegeria sp.]|uniref:nucleotidyl transferase AbiEii/AbiGii toxin family protein n=1 Tax=Ruegeria sp. TaxID=1879320 RepID=UPI003B000499
MIPRDYITEWRTKAPWVEDFQVEQDLVISRALVEIFSHPQLRESLAFRGGTALYKLHIDPPARYSEDIDLVQIRAEPIGPTLDALRAVLDPWLGKPQWKQNEGRVTLSYRFGSEDVPPQRLRLKVEINSREHFTLFGLRKKSFAISSRWFIGEAKITTYTFNELLGTKLRALYQRRKGRDLFDLAVALKQSGIDPVRVVEAFLHYMTQEGSTITRALFERNLAAKLRMPLFTADIGPLLAAGYGWDIHEAAADVSSQLIRRLPGDPWKGE